MEFSKVASTTSLVDHSGAPTVHSIHHMKMERNESSRFTSREESADEILPMTEEESIALEDSFTNTLMEQRETPSEEDSPLPFMQPNANDKHA